MYNNIFTQLAISKSGYVKPVHIEPKLAYKLNVQKMDVVFYQINMLSGQKTPLYLRTSLTNQSGQTGDCIGIDMYWSYDNPRPSPQDCEG